jgi:hypothetical protein
MSLAEYLLGLLLLGAIVVAAALAGRALRRYLLPAWHGAPARLADAVLALGVVVVLGQALGAVGAFRIWALVPAAIVLAAAVAAALARRRPKAAADAPAAGPPPTRAETMLCAGGAVAVVGQWGAGTAAALDRGMLLPDTLWYHMPFAARFVQDGWLTRLHYTDVEPFTVFYPMNSELLHAVGIAAFSSNDVLSPFLNLAFVALGLLAGWCIGRPYGAAPLSLLGAALALSLPIHWGINAGQAGNDVVGTALFLAAVALLVNARARGAGLLLAALAAGLAVGTKLSLVAPVLALAVGAVALAPRGRRLAAAGGFAIAAAAGGGYWYARNLVNTGSPLPWLDVELGPISWAGPPRELTEGYEFAVVRYLADPDIWSRYFFDGLDYAFGSAWFAVLALAAAGAVGAALRGDRIGRALGLVALACVAAYLITPNGAAGREGEPWAFGLNLRYAIPGVALALAVLPTWLSDARLRRIALAALLVALAFTLLSPTGLWSYRRDDAVAIGAVAAALAALSVAVPRASGRTRLAAAGGLAALVLGLLVAGFAVQRDYLRDRYARVGPNVPRTSVWARDLRDARIGILGFTAQYPLYGRELSNRIRHVGRRRPRAGFGRIRDCREWRRALNEGRYRYVVVSPVVSYALPPGTPTSVPPEVAWTRSDPAAREILRDGPTTSVLRVASRLDPGGCARG